MIAKQDVNLVACPMAGVCKRWRACVFLLPEYVECWMAHSLLRPRWNPLNLSTYHWSGEWVRLGTTVPEVWAPAFPAPQCYSIVYLTPDGAVEERHTFLVERNGKVYESSIAGLDKAGVWGWRTALSTQTFCRPDGTTVMLKEVPFDDYVPNLNLEDNNMATFLDVYGLFTLESHVFEDGTCTLIDPEIGYGFHLADDLKVIGSAMTMEALLPASVKVRSSTLAEPSGDVYFLMTSSVEASRIASTLMLVKLSPHVEPQRWPIPSRYAPREGPVCFARCGTTIAWYAAHIGCIVAVSVKAPFDLQSGLILNELRVITPLSPGIDCRLWFEGQRFYLAPQDKSMHERAKYFTLYWTSLL
jgi:hypothetical protein